MHPALKSEAPADLGYPVGRLVSIILALTPFAVVTGVMIISSQAQGWVGVGYAIIMIMCIPFLLLFSIASVVMAFRKTTKMRLEKTAKSISVFSVCITGAATFCWVVIILPRLMG